MSMEVKFEKLKKYAKDNHVPIILDEGLLVLETYIKSYKNPSILEIGSAIGYSACKFAYMGAHVTTIERDLSMYHLALENINTMGFKDKIHLIHEDALKPVSFHEKFDIIFIDAAKSKYQDFFNLYETYLHDDGVIICDNIHFHHLNIKDVSRRTKSLLLKIEKFKAFLSNHENYQTVFLDDGDGLSVSRKV